MNMDLLQYLLSGNTMAGDPNSFEFWNQGMPQSYQSPSMLSIPPSVQSLGGTYNPNYRMDSMSGAGTMGPNAIANNGMPSTPGGHMPTTTPNKFTGLLAPTPMTTNAMPPPQPAPAPTPSFPSTPMNWTGPRGYGSGEGK